jgi:hypothetical protein
MAADPKFQQAFSAVRNIAAFNQAIESNQKMCTQTRENLAKLFPSLTKEQQDLLQANATQLGISIT